MRGCQASRRRYVTAANSNSCRSCCGVVTVMTPWDCHDDGDSEHGTLRLGLCLTRSRARRALSESTSSPRQAGEGHVVGVGALRLWERKGWRRYLSLAAHLTAGWWSGPVTLLAVACTGDALPVTLSGPIMRSPITSTPPVLSVMRTGPMIMLGSQPWLPTITGPVAPAMVSGPMSLALGQVWRPTGDQAAKPSANRECVSLRCPLPSAFTT